MCTAARCAVVGISRAGRTTPSPASEKCGRPTTFSADGVATMTRAARLQSLCPIRWRQPVTTRTSRLPANHEASRQGAHSGRAQIVARRPDGKPSVLIIVQNLPLPLDRRVWLESLALRDAGYHVSVICPRGDGQRRHEVLLGVHLYTYRPPRASSGVASYVAEFLYCWLMTALLSLLVMREQGFDVIQTCNPPDTYWALALPYKLVFGTAFVFDHHDLCPEVYQSRFGVEAGGLHRLLLWLERRNLRTADVVISTNDSYKAIAVRRGGRAPEDVYVVRSGPNPDVMRRGAPEPALRCGREHLAVWLGVMGPQDGVDELLDIIAYFVRDLGREDCQFALLGFGDEEQALRLRCTLLQLDDFVTFTGKADADMITTYLSTASIGLSADPSNPLNDLSTMNKTMEYMSYGLAVVAFDLPETRVSAQQAAVYLQPGDKAGYAATIVELLADPVRRERLGAFGRTRIERELAWSLQAATYLQAFARLTPLSAAR